MLTIDEILKVGKSLQDIPGDCHAGFGNEPVTSCYTHDRSAERNTDNDCDLESVTFSLSEYIDEETGDVRIVKKD